jgi:hypothetical protein
MAPLAPLPPRADGELWKGDGTVDWIAKEDGQGFCLEAKFLTHRGVRRELEKSSFMRNSDDSDDVNSYIRYWPDGYHAVAHIHPRANAGRVKVTITYHDSEGTKFRKSPLEGTLSVGEDHRLLVPHQPTSAIEPLSSMVAGRLAHAFAAVRSALGKSKYENWLEQQ